MMRLSQSSIDRVTSVFAELDLGDPRRKERLLRTVSNLASNPRVSFPEAMGTEAEIEGGYRLMNSPHVTMGALNDAHAVATAKLAAKAGSVLAIHDTTTFEFKQADPKEIGYLHTGKPGFLVHYALIVSADESHRPLGISSVEEIVRRKRPKKRSPKKTSVSRSARYTARDPQRESLRWGRGFDATSKLLEDVEVIHVADREGDNYELLVRGEANRQRFVIRARVTERSVTGPDGAVETLRTVLDGARGRLSREVQLSARKRDTAPKSRHQARDARSANLEFSAERVVLRRPVHQSPELPQELEINVVRVFEPNPPAGETPVEWVLYTTEPVRTKSEIAAVVDIYRARWLIEECNKALKTGCRYEDRQFESPGALLNLLAMTFPIAVELLALRAACRRSPNRPAAEVLTALQLTILRAMASRKLEKHATVHDALWAVAGLGGHMKTNGEPGWLVLHRGMTKLLAYEEGWKAAQIAAGLPISQ